MTPEKPILLLTMRRTGGTSFMSFLETVSSFPSVEHEPLNSDRVWGTICSNYLASKNIDRLRRDLELATQQKPNIKHCFDVIEEDITNCLISLCANLGYEIFVLTRRDESSRLKSLVVALMTEAWWLESSAKIYQSILADDGAMPIPDPLLIRSLAITGNQRLMATYQYLTDSHINYSSLCYENIFFPNKSLSRDICSLLLKAGISCTSSDLEEAMHYFSPERRQGTAEFLKKTTISVELALLISSLVKANENQI